MRLHSPKEITTYTYHHHKVVKLKFEFTNLQLVCNKLYFAESSYYCDYIRGFVAEKIIQRPKTYLMFCSHKCKLQTRRVDLKYYVFLYSTPFPQGLYIAMSIPITNVGGRTINTYSHNYETTIQNASSTKVRYKYRFICKTTNNLSIFDIQVFFLHPPYNFEHYNLQFWGYVL